MNQDQLNHELQQLDQLSQSQHPLLSQPQHPPQHHQSHTNPQLEHQHQHSHPSLFHMAPPQMELGLQLQQQQQQQQLNQQQQEPQQPHPGLQQQQQQQQQLLDSTPQDVLAEARKNLQLLIDNGLSKDFLHQWVDNDLSHQLSLPCQQQALPHSFAPAVSPPSSVATSPLPSPSLTQTPTHAHSHLQSPSHDHGSLLSSPLQQSLPPPPPQVTSGAISIMAHVSPVASASGLSTAATSPIVPSNSPSMPPPTTEVTLASATAPAIVIKSETFGEPGSWSASLAQAPAPSLPRSHPAQDISYNGLLNHHPRMSISSISSASSGHGSIWSVNSARSTASWASAATSRSMAPLPMAPPMTSSSAAPLITNPQSAVASKQNIYWCTSCETSFKRKYDWKRHEDEFHERWRKYPCPEPGCNRSFWGSNSFNQHHKQCHGCKTCPHAEKVVRQLRKRKYWACGFCSALHPARERHVEHVARHFESGLTKADWMHSRVIYGLLHQPLIHPAWEALVAAKYGDCGARRPQFSWHPNKTGRAQGFLEKECPGQLQDRLEFFSGEERDVQWIVNMAFDLADIVLTTPPSSSQALPHPSAPLTVTSQQFLPSGMAPPGALLQQPDRGLPFPSVQPVPSQASQQGMLASPVSNAPSSFSSSPYQSQIFVPSPNFASLQQPSPESMTQSPLVPSHPHLDKQDLPPISTEASGSMIADGMMDFEYSPAGVVFEDWEGSSSSHLLNAPNHQQQQQQQQHQQQHQQQQQQQQQLPSPNDLPPAPWGIPQYFNDPSAPL